MKRRALRVPAALVFALGSTAALVATTSISCSGDDEGASCTIYCFENGTDAGVPPDGGCPLCADLSSGTPTCPSGCAPEG